MRDGNKLISLIAPAVPLFARFETDDGDIFSPVVALAGYMYEDKSGSYVIPLIADDIGISPAEDATNYRGLVDEIPAPTVAKGEGVDTTAADRTARMEEDVLAVEEAIRTGNFDALAARAVIDPLQLIRYMWAVDRSIGMCMDAPMRKRADRENNFGERYMAALKAKESAASPNSTQENQP